MSKITWKQEKRKLGDLLPWMRNPRQIKDKQSKRLLESWEDFGQVETLAVGPSGEIYNGHQRLNVLRAKYGADYEVDVRVASRPLNEKEREKLTVYLHKGAAGEWNFDMLANEFELDELLAWGFEEFELGIGDAVESTDVMAEWQGMPEFENEDVFGAIKTIKVHFATQQDIDTFSRLMEQTVTMDTKSIWYPKQEHENLKEYVAHES